MKPSHVTIKPSLMTDSADVAGPITETPTMANHLGKASKFTQVPGTFKLAQTLVLVD